MRFSTFYLVTGVSSLILGLILAVNGYTVLNFLMPVVMILLVTGIMLKFFEHLIEVNQKKIPSYEEILKIYNKMLEADKKKRKE